MGLLKPPLHGRGEVFGDEILVTPSQVFLRLSWSKVMSAKASLHILNRKKSAGARSSE
jgi:hypothetical protein